MNYHFKKLVVVALGGSIVCPKNINILFLKKFKKFIREFTGQGFRFVLVIGGGRLARNYQAAASKIDPLSDEEKDWIGIYATRLNAYLVKSVFSGLADPKLVEGPGEIKKRRYSVVVAAGWHPGWSTDYVAVALAKELGAGEAVIAGKPAYVCDKDPVVFKNAKILPELNWTRYKKLVPAKWQPGLASPVDPPAACLAEKEGIAAIIINGKDLRNFSNLLRGKTFKGSVIK